MLQHFDLSTPHAELAALRSRVAELEGRLLVGDEGSSRPATRQSQCYRRLADAAIEAIVLHDDGVILDVNEACVRLFAQQRDDLIGRPITDLATVGERAKVLSHLSGEGERVLDTLAMRADGSTFPVQWHARATRYDSRLVQVAAIRDVSQAVPAAEALNASLELNRRIVEAVPGGVIQVAPDGAIVSANPEAIRMLGLTYDERTGNYAADCESTTISDDGTPGDPWQYPITKCLLTGQPQPATELAIRRPHQLTVWAVFRVVPLESLEVRGVRGAVATFLDITERRRAERELERMHRDLAVRICERTAELSEANKNLTREIAERLRAEGELRSEKQLLKHVLAAHERHQSLTAYEIHDGLVQNLIGALMQVEALEDRLAGDVRQDLRSPVALLRRAINAGRRLISGLRPPIIDEQGVVAAVDYLVVESQSPPDLIVSFHHRVKFERVDPLLEATIFRIVQECLSNVRRHSRSPRARVAMRQVGQRVRITVRDWGVGFDPKSVTEQQFGLRSVRERARLLGGRATINSSQGQGTRIEIELPLTIGRQGG